MYLDFNLWIWGLLALAIVIAFLDQRELAIGTAIAVVIAGLFTNKIGYIGAIFVLLGFALAVLIHKTNKINRVFCIGLLIAWSAALFLHIVPGFHNLKVLDHVIAKPNSAPFTMYLNLDKPLIFFALLIAFPRLLGSGAKPNNKGIILTAIPLFGLLFVAQWLGAIKPEFGIPSWWWLFALNNLLLTCVAEEAFFRGFLQREIDRKLGWVAGLLIASVLFGLAHFAGGLTLMIFAGLAGLGYGLVFYFSNRLWAAVLVHFLFNFVHLVFFTYPALAR
ncbi:CPBP family intramembrane glutamic endopeptidase [Vibrio marisflavi]|uniref:CAAX prenyl protease 2/Lysostaphin resistance protein A-like domain-containing protein n=1 Tax=Vibrio marisflavi CECT 7928 TaxID=634439 RepID=A0ABM9A5U3_9VIBR|nr:CPBP family intramembrane glutamic endopeptidase [Vibrio marisflavi]CAH0540517.1 hypothetical protein VMF7928_02917 [Vibrio marisflavi CECT 7928]